MQRNLSSADGAEALSAPIRRQLQYSPLSPPPLTTPPSLSLLSGGDIWRRETFPPLLPLGGHLVFHGSIVDAALLA